MIGVLEPAPFFPDHVDALLNMVISPHHVSAQMVEGRTHRMTEMIARLAPGATVEQARAEVAAVQDPHHERVQGSLRPGIALSRRRHPVQGGAGRTRAADAVAADGRGGLRHDHLGRQRGEPDAHARRPPRARARRAGGARCRRGAAATAAPGREPGADAHGWRARRDHGRIGGVGLLISLAERYSPRASEISLDLVALGFTLAVSVAVALLLSFVASLPKEGTFAALDLVWRAADERERRRQRLQRALVVAQVAVRVVLLAGAGLLTRTMMQLSDVSTGLRTEEVLTHAGAAVGSDQRMLRDRRWRTGQLYDRMRREIRALPGVIEVGLGSTMPLAAHSDRFRRQGRRQTSRRSARRRRTPELRTASPEYFRAAGIPLLKGREFSDTDERDRARW